MSRIEEVLPVRHRAECGIDVPIIRNVVTRVGPRTDIDRGQPDVVNAERLQDRQLGLDPFEVYLPIPCTARVEKKGVN